MDDDGFLPEPIIHRILSFLPRPEIMKAALVCKSWSRACSSFPILDFDIQDFLGKINFWGPQAPGFLQLDQFMMMKLERMMQFVDKTMTRFQEQPLKIDKFGIRYLYCGGGYGSATDRARLVSKWIGIALDNNVEELRIAIRGYARYLISERILSAPSVKSMELAGGRLSPPSSFLNEPAVNLKNLRSLALELFSIDDQVFDRLVNACKSLESLSVKCCTDLKEIRVYGPRNLKRVDLRTSKFTRLAEIEAPSLENFDLSCYSPVESFLPAVNHSPNLRSMHLTNNAAVTNEWLGEFLSRFPVLEDLTVSSCSTLTSISILNPSVKSIAISRCSRLIDINLDTPELTSFKLEADGGRLPFVWTAENCVCRSCDVKLSIDDIYAGLEDWSRRLREFLIGSCKSFASLSFRVFTRETDFRLLRMDIDNKDRWLASVACNLRQLQQSPDLGTLSRKIENELGGVPAIDPTNCSFLLTCHPNTVALVAGLSGDGFLQFFFERLASRIQDRSRLCFADGRRESWPCQLKDMKITQITPGSNCEVPIGEHCDSATI